LFRFINVRVCTLPRQPQQLCRPLLGYLTREEIQAVLNPPDATTWSGHRVQVLFAVMYNTGARVSEVAGSRRDDLADGQPRSLRIRSASCTV
jgi:site-specific recombinase XerD